MRISILILFLLTPGLFADLVKLTILRSPRGHYIFLYGDYHEKPEKKDHEVNCLTNVFLQADKLCPPYSYCIMYEGMSITHDPNVRDLLTQEQLLDFSNDGALDYLPLKLKNYTLPNIILENIEIRTKWPRLSSFYHLGNMQNKYPSFDWLSFYTKRFDHDVHAINFSYSYKIAESLEAKVKALQAEWVRSTHEQRSAILTIFKKCLETYKTEMDAVKKEIENPEQSYLSYAKEHNDEWHEWYPNDGFTIVCYNQMIDYIDKFIIDACVCLFDLYALDKLLKYDEKTIDRIVLIAGDAHRQNLAHYLEEVGYTPIYKDSFPERPYEAIPDTEFLHLLKSDAELEQLRQPA